MGDKYLNLSELNLEGKFLGFAGFKSGKAKYIQLAVPSGNLLIKLPKELRDSLMGSLVPGEQIRVHGVSKVKAHTGKIKLKAHQITPVNACLNEELSAPPQAKIMVCKQFGCVKRGGESLLSELERILCDRGWQDKVKIEFTDCQKCCNDAPNCTLILGNKKYKKLNTEAIASLLENHFS